MTKLMAWAALAGALVGLVFFGAECWVEQRKPNEVIFDAGYEPLPGVEVATEYNSAFSTSLALEETRPSDWWSLSTLSWWAYPLIGAASAAVLAAPFAIAGVRVSRVRR
ncbi:hypothetical protein HQ602_17255 [Rhodococcus kroppenstedtii]|uniref:hypothetical protein n=1 Tax=Rhodococcoides kroppenstedtii TaxID=293050 RepID=UPI001C9AC022|nr:hypothetical protein [Rhodococcus kroppenstedtii]MBY6438124.1 hypothetical protein [Rhodococcus kroppenstedtii]